MNKLFHWFRTTELWIKAALILVIMMCPGCLILMMGRLPSTVGSVIGVAAFLLCVILVFRYGLYKKLMTYLWAGFFVWMIVQGIVAEAKTFLCVFSTIQRNWYICTLAFIVFYISAKERKRNYITSVLSVWTICTVGYLLLSLASACAELFVDGFVGKNALGHFTGGRLSVFGNPNSVGIVAATLVLVSLWNKVTLSRSETIVIKTVGKSNSRKQSLLEDVEAFKSDRIAIGKKRLSENEDYKEKRILTVLLEIISVGGMIVGVTALSFSRSRGSIVATAFGIATMVFICVYSRKSLPDGKSQPTKIGESPDKKDKNDSYVEKGKLPETEDSTKDGRNVLCAETIKYIGVDRQTRKEQRRGNSSSYNEKLHVTLSFVVAILTFVISIPLLFVPKLSFDRIAPKIAYSIGGKAKESDVANKLEAYGVTYAIDTLTDRTSIWPSTIRMMNENPTSWEWGNYNHKSSKVKIYDVYDGRPEIMTFSAHNGYIQQLYLHGPAGTSILLILFLWWTVKSVKLAFVKYPNERKTLQSEITRDSNERKTSQSEFTRDPNERRSSQPEFVKELGERKTSQPEFEEDPNERETSKQALEERSGVGTFGNSTFVKKSGAEISGRHESARTLDIKKKIPLAVVTAAMISAMVEAFLFPDFNIYPITFFYFAAIGVIFANMSESKERSTNKYVFIIPLVFVVVTIAIITGIKLSRNATDSVSMNLPVLKEQNANDYVRLNNYVTSNMMSSDYWIELKKNSGENTSEALLIYSEIAAINYTNRRMISTEGAEFALNDVGTEFYVKVAKQLIEDVEIKDIDPSNYIYEEKETTKEFWDTIKKNANKDALTERITTRFGYSVTRDVLKRYPTDCKVYEKESSLYYDELAQSDLQPFMPVAVLHESADEEWYYVITYGYGGWTRKENVALCRTRDEWIELQECEDFIVVTGKELRLSKDPYQESLSDLSVPMGTKLPIVSISDAPESLHDRIGYGNYIAKLPKRGEDGYTEYTYVLIPTSEDISLDYLPYTQENVAELTFKHLGSVYGWAGDNYSQDCSGYVREVYACFGFELPRSAKAQSLLSGVENIDVKRKSIEEKTDILKTAPIGTMIYFPGHIMMYVGTVDGVPYCISSVGDFSTTELGKGNVVDVNTVILTNMADTTRGSGLSWIEATEKIIIP